MGHLEDPELTADLQVARDVRHRHDGTAAVALHGLHRDGPRRDAGVGLASVSLLFGFTWWAPLVLGGAWGSTHWLLRESAVWRDRNTAEVQARAARRGLRLPARGRAAGGEGAAAVRAGRLDARPLHAAVAGSCTTCSTRPPGCASARWRAVRRSSSRATPSCSGRWPTRRPTVASSLGTVVVFAQAAVGASLDRVRRAELGARRGGRAGRRGATPAGRDGARGDAVPRHARRSRPAARPELGLPGRHVRLPGHGPAGPRGLRPHRPGGLLARHRRPERRRQDHTGQAAVPPLRPHVRRDRGRRGGPARASTSTAWRARVTAVFQDFIRFELPLRDNVAPAGAPDERGARRARGGGRGRPGRARPAAGEGLRGRHRPVGRPVAAGRPGPGAVRGAAGAGVVLLDEPTAQLDVRGEAEIFDRVLAATRHCTTILVSHRFSTVRHADRICVLEHGRVVELGTHDELMAPPGATARCSTCRPSASWPRRRTRGWSSMSSAEIAPDDTGATTTCRHRVSSMWRLVQARLPVRAAAARGGPRPARSPPPCRTRCSRSGSSCWPRA